MRARPRSVSPRLASKLNRRNNVGPIPVHGALAEGRSTLRRLDRTVRPPVQQGSCMKRRMTGLLGIFVAMSLVTLVAPPVSASTPSHTTFADVVAGSKLVVLARIHIRSDGGVHLVIERVLKGRSGLVRDYPPILQ